MGKKYSFLFVLLISGLLLAWLPGSVVGPAGGTVSAWNNLGMHCLDADFSIFASPWSSGEAALLSNETGTISTFVVPSIALDTRYPMQGVPSLLAGAVAAELLSDGFKERGS